MPRKPARHCRSARCLPLSFSPFARSVAQIASNNKVTHKVPNSRFPESNLPSSSGKRMEKRRLVDKSENSGSSDYEESDGTVQADFEFFDPKPSDFHGVKILLQTYLDNKQWDLSGFVDVILGQPTVGTVVKIENDEDDGIYSIVTALNLGRYKPTEELRNSFCFKFYLVISKIYKHKNAVKQNGPSGDQTVVYIKAEDEIFLELKDYRLTGLVMAIDASKIPTFRQKLHSLIEEA